MIEIIQRNTLRFVVAMILQVIIFNNLELFGFINPFFYLLFIILLPFETPKALSLFLALLLGLSIDIFTNTIGIHAASTVLIAFLRPTVLQYFAPRDGYEVNTAPRISFYGVTWFVKFAGAIVIIHSVFFYCIDAFSFVFMGRAILFGILNGLFTLLLLVLSQYLFFKK